MHPRRAGLTDLTELYLASHRIANPTPLSGLTKLVQLDLSGNEISDVSPLAGSWLQTGPDLMVADFGQDWTVDFRDLAVLAANWLGPIVIREFRFDASPGWTMQGQWQFGPPQGNGGSAQGRPDPNAGYTGANVYGVNLAGPKSTSAGAAKSSMTPIPAPAGTSTTRSSTEIVNSCTPSPRPGPRSAPAFRTERVNICPL